VATEVLTELMKLARGAVGDVGLVALVVGSVVTSELLEAAGRARAETPASGDLGDAYARAMTWATARAKALAGTATAPAVTPERLARLVEAGAATGLSLVEPETGAILAGSSTAPSDGGPARARARSRCRSAA
jgi:hypothetical protein